MALSEVVARIRKAEMRAGRDAGSVTLIAVSKVQSDERVQAVLHEGHRRFGENRVQEAEERWSRLKCDAPDVVLHLIGPLQTNKVKAALQLFDVIESVDRLKLAEKLASGVQALGRAPAFLVQVNTGEEPQKAGVAPGDADAFIAQCRGTLELPIAGLMAIPPADQPPAPYFALLAKIAERNGLPQLSMGMSADFEIAIEMGATSVRVGSAVFGARPKADV